MGYVAGKLVRITRDGVDVELRAGEAFPEAPTLPTFKALVNTGFAVWVPEGMQSDSSITPAQMVKAQKKVVKVIK